MSTMIWILKSIFHWHWDIFVSLIDWLLKVNQNYLSNGFFHATFKCKHINTVQQHFQKYGQLQLAAPLPPSLNSLMHYVGEDAVKSSMNLYFRHCVGLVCEKLMDLQDSWAVWNDDLITVWWQLEILPSHYGLIYISRNPPQQSIWLQCWV